MLTDTLQDVPNPNGVVAKGDIPIVTKFITNIQRKHGEITPELVVKEGRVPGSPLFKYFTNNVKEAAEKYWLDEARQIIRSVYVKIIYPDREAAPVRKWVPVTPTESRPEARGYMDIVDVCADEYLRQQQIDRAIQDIKIWKERYEAIKDFSAEIKAVFSALDSLPRKSGKKKKKR